MPVETRDAIYRAVLEALELRREARTDLERRRLSNDAIASGVFRSIPRKGKGHSAFLAQMKGEVGESALRRCPGFLDKKGRLTFWSAVGNRDGYIVPYVDERGRITGLQMKLLGGKYITARGAKLSGVYHVAGAGKPADDLYLTEGGLKALVSAALGGIWCFGLPGQSLHPGHLDAIKALNAARVIVAFDQEANENTAKAQRKAERALHDAGLKVARAVWEGADVGGPKGLDDLLQAGGRPRITTVSFGPKELNRKRRVRRVATPGPVAGGDSIDVVRERTAKVIGKFVGMAPRRPGTALVVRTPPGTGKTTALAQSVQQPGVRPLVLAGTKKLAREMANEHGYVLIEGRSSDNCQRYDVVEALRKNGHDVERLACGSDSEPRCPFRGSCVYLVQFEAIGPRVAAAEQLYNPRFLRGGNLVVLDDADLMRTVVAKYLVEVETLDAAVKQLRGRRRKAALELLRLLQHSVIDVPEKYLTGAAVWNHLSRTAVRYNRDLGALIRSLPESGSLPDPGEDRDGYVSVATVEAVPPASILRIFSALRDELPRFEAGGDFNSRIRLSGAGIEVRELREHISGRDGPLVGGLAMLILDATPVEALVDHITVLHDRLEDVDGAVRLPENVQVVQYATGGNGHVQLRDEDARAAALDEIRRERERHPVVSPHLEGLVAFKALTKAAQEAVGFPPDRIHTFGSVRGSNALVGVERLHVLGRPMPPSEELAYLAQVIHHDEPAIDPARVMRERRYGGQPYAVDVVEFADERVSALLKSARDDELVQVIHRARLLTLRAQQSFDGGDDRRDVRLILHTNHPIPGLRVDELILPEDGEERLGNIFEASIDEDMDITTKNGWEQTQEPSLGNENEASIKALEEDEKSIPQTIVPPPTPCPPETATSVPDFRPGWSLCGGGCGTPMPRYQKCPDCAAAAVRAWKAQRGARTGRRRSTSSTRGDP